MIPRIAFFLAFRTITVGLSTEPECVGKGSAQLHCLSTGSASFVQKGQKLGRSTAFEDGPGQHEQPVRAMLAEDSLSATISSNTQKQPVVIKPGPRGPPGPPGQTGNVISAPGQKQAGGPSIAVLLTTYNEPQRTEMYAKRLDWWLTQTMLPLFVVDSYNRKFPEEGQTRFRQFRVHHFDQFPILGPPPFGGSTISELLSLKEALKAFQNEWEQYDYVVKVTGKYILPDLVALMANIDKGKDFIVEASAFSLNANTNPNPGWVGTECITFNTKKMGELVAKIEQQPYPAIENKLAALLHTHTFQRLPPMPIPDAYRIKRAIGDTLTSVIEEGKGAL